MLDQQILKLYELKGHLEARSEILDTAALFTQRLQAKLRTDRYNGYADGQIKAYQEWQRDVTLILSEVEQIIKEIQGVSLEPPTP